jgi:hypothetical protein
MTDRRIRQAFFMIIAVTVGWQVAIPGGRAFGLPICTAAQIACGSIVGPPNCKVAPGTVLNCPNACVLTLNANYRRVHMNNLVINCGGSGGTGVCINGNHDLLRGPGVITNCAKGVSTTGAHDAVIRVTAISNTTGFSVTSAITSHNSLIHHSEAIANGLGIDLEGAPRNIASGNIADLNTGDGIYGNTNLGTGIILDNVASANNAGNATGAGIELDGNCTAVSVGFNVAGFNGIGGNTLNFEDDTVAPPCGTDVWGGNNTPVPGVALVNYTPACAH